MKENTKRDLEILRITRQNILNLVKDLSYDQICLTPKGFSNSILWNFVHNAVTQQILCFGRYGMTPLIDKYILDKFSKGSLGSNTISENEYESLKKRYIELVDRTEEQYPELIKSKADRYTTSYNITLNSLDETIQFINTHEGLHFGIMMALKKFV